MKIVQTLNRNQTRIMWAAVALAFLAAFSYLLMELNVLGVGSIQGDEKPAGIAIFAGGCYLLGGLLILLRKRWLLLFGAFINAMVILFFFSMYQARPEVMFSPGGLVSKLAEILLEISLLLVLIAYWKQSK